MSERDAVAATAAGPVTVETLAGDFRALGVEPGMVLLLHSSLRSLGWVCGRAQAVIEALEEVLGPAGTLVVPTHSAHLSDPAHWENPPVPEAWWDTIRRTMPPYDLAMTPSRKMGAIADCLRSQSGAIRSAHPTVSFAARGPHAEAIVGSHPLDFGLGEGSPLARIYDLVGWVLLLGVGHDRNTSLHLAEHRAEWPGKRELLEGAPMLVDGQRRWVPWRTFDLDSDDFTRVGEDFETATGLARRGNVAAADSRLLPQRALVDHAVAWFELHRT